MPREKAIADLVRSNSTPNCTGISLCLPSVSDWTERWQSVREVSNFSDGEGVCKRWCHNQKIEKRGVKIDICVLFAFCVSAYINHLVIFLLKFLYLSRSMCFSMKSGGRRGNDNVYSLGREGCVIILDKHFLDLCLRNLTSGYSCHPVSAQWLFLNQKVRLYICSPIRHYYILVGLFGLLFWFPDVFCWPCLPTLCHTKSWGDVRVYMILSKSQIKAFLWNDPRNVVLLHTLYASLRWAAKRAITSSRLFRLVNPRSAVISTREYREAILSVLCFNPYLVLSHFWSIQIQGW